MGPIHLLALCLVALAVLVAPGCGSTDAETPDACLAGERAYLSALEAAPGEVRLAGGTPISECLAENQPGGPLETVGTAMVGAASDLNAAARRNPGGPAAPQLGYLVGATERGAEETAGIHAELVRRLEAAATYNTDGRPLPPELVAAYQDGRAAGREGG
jgi:hypothetical protein